jgi:hypothetical protein
MAKRSHMRNADSGVFLGSDFSEDNVESSQSSEDTVPDSEIEDEGRPGPARALKPQVPPTPEVLASKAINHCLETGHESVDLSDLAMTTLSNATLKLLHQLIKHSHDDLTAPPSEDEFSPLTPSIRLFLSGNKLTSLPSELFRLTNISVLSLRNNELHDIPPSIGRLPNLQELNIAQNNVQWLPWEMFDLVHCRGNHRQITVRPNPLIDPTEDLQGPSPLLSRPKVTGGEYIEHLNRWGETNGAFFRKMQQWYSEEDTAWTMRHELELRLKLGRLKQNMYMQEASRAGLELKLCKEQLIFLASSAIRYFDARGTPCTGNKLARVVDEEQKYQAVVDPFMNQPQDREPSNIASLFETTLRKIQSNFTLHDLPEGLPAAVASALEAAARGSEHGNEKCSVCKNEFIVARAEWMEFWFNGFPRQDCLTLETILPFLRRVCSWECAQPNEMGAFRF